MSPQVRHFTLNWPQRSHFPTQWTYDTTKSLPSVTSAFRSLIVIAGYGRQSKRDADGVERTAGPVLPTERRLVIRERVGELWRTDSGDRVERRSG